MIILCGFGPAFGLPDASPFVLKVDTYMRMAGIPFEYKNGIDNLKIAPKKKLPVILDGDRIVPDSQEIIEYLKTEKNADLDSWLSPEQKAISYLATKSIDENFYWCLVNSRWVNMDTWPTTRETLFSSMPFPIKQILPVILRKGVIKDLKAHGIGRHSNAELLHIGQQNLQSLSDLLGDKPFFMGDKPCTLDATAYGILAELILATVDNDLNAAARKYPNLVAFCDRIKAQYFPDQS